MPEPVFDIKQFVKTDELKSIETPYGVFNYGSVTNKDMLLLSKDITDESDDTEVLLRMTYLMLSKAYPSLTYKDWENFDPMVAKAIIAEIGNLTDFRVSE